MKKAISFLAFILLLILASCSPEQIALQNNPEIRARPLDTISELRDGSIPGYKLIYKVKSGISIAQLQKMYIKDIEQTLPEYDNNLKNMWFIKVHNIVKAEGTEETKRFFINEQCTLPQNLPNLESFYTLLESCKGFMAPAEMRKIGNDFAKKNREYIENKIQWSSKEAKDNKLSELNAGYNRFINYVPAVKG